MNMYNMTKFKIVSNLFIQKFQPCYYDKTGRKDDVRAVNTFDGAKLNGLISLYEL